MVCALSFALALAGPLAGCGQSIDPEKFPSLADYQSWPVIQTTGRLPAHQDTIRLIYTNEVALTYPGVGWFRPGAVIVKDVFERRGDGSRGDLRYVAIMRKLDEALTPAGIELEQGWLFTIASEVGKTERTGTCWWSCHVQAPYDGAWLNYGARE